MPKKRELPQILVHTLEQTIDSVVVIDQDNTVIFFNRSAEQLWGYTKEEVTGTPIRELITEELWPMSAKLVVSEKTKSKSGRGISSTVPIHRKDGSRVWGSMSVSTIDSEGQTYYAAFIKDVTAHHDSAEHAHLLSMVADQTDNAIMITNGDWQVVYINPGFSRMFGYRPEQVLGMVPTTFLARQPTDAAIQTVRLLLSSGRAFKSEELALTENGERLWCSVTSNPVFDYSGVMSHIVTVVTNITTAKMHEVLQRRVLEAMAREEPLENVMNLVCREIERLLPEFTTSILRIDEDNLLHPLAAPKLPPHYCQALEGQSSGTMAGSCGTAAYRKEEVVASDIENDPLWEDYKHLVLPLGLKSCWSTPIKGSNKRVLGTVAFYHPEVRTPTAFDRQLIDVIVPLCALALEREESRSHIRQLAFYDSLTGLPNRSLLLAEAERAVVQAKQRNGRLAVFFIDLDRFKQVNDTLGHPAGDALLKIIAERLKQNLRHADIAGRLSGDEFVVVLSEYDPSHVAEVVEQLRQNIAQSCLIGGVTLSPSASIGVSLFPQDGYDIGTLIHRADMAMYQAKSAGRSRYSFFSHKLNQLMQERQALEDALRDALQNNALELNYQPQIKLDNGQLYGLEALVRWVHPLYNHTSPARFVALAEECGLISELGHWAIVEACRQLAIWRAKGLKIPMISVNLSPMNFHNLELPDLIMQTLADNGLSAEDLTLEITESILVDTNPAIIKTIQAVHEQGIRLSMDDFGTGYSSLSYLRRLPISELKLDRSFVNDLESDTTSRALSDAVIRIGESLNLIVVAEGIETQSQHAILKKQGYHVGQGYLYSPPLPAKEVENWLSNSDIQAIAGQPWQVEML